jgi:hypothetical protein
MIGSRDDGRRPSAERIGAGAGPLKMTPNVTARREILL